MIPPLVDRLFFPRFFRPSWLFDSPVGWFVSFRSVPYFILRLVHWVIGYVGGGGLPYKNDRDARRRVVPFRAKNLCIGTAYGAKMTAGRAVMVPFKDP